MGNANVKGGVGYVCVTGGGGGIHTGRPRMRRAEGESRLSESPTAVASTRKVHVVSNDILRSGDAECFIPMRFIGLCV